MISDTLPKETIIGFTSIQNEQTWLRAHIAWRISVVNGEKTSGREQRDLYPPPLADTDDEYSKLIAKYQFNPEERLLLALALCNHYDPRTLNGLMETAQLQLAARCQKSENGFSVIPTAERFFLLFAGKVIPVY